MFLIPFSAFSEEDDDRVLFDAEALKSQGFAQKTVFSFSTDKETGFKLYIFELPETGGESYGNLSRVFIVRDDRVEYDSFEWDSVNLSGGKKLFHSFYSASAQAFKGKHFTDAVSVSGKTIASEEGEPLKVMNRVVILKYAKDAGFDIAAEASSAKNIEVKKGSVGVKF